MSAKTLKLRYYDLQVYELLDLFVMNGLRVEGLDSNQHLQSFLEPPERIWDSLLFYQVYSFLLSTSRTYLMSIKRKKK